MMTNRIQKILTLFALVLFSQMGLAVTTCGIELPGKYQSAGSNPELEIEIFKNMPHYSYYLHSPSHNLILIAGEKELNPNDVKSLSKLTLESWSQNKLKENLELFPARKYNLMESIPFINQIAGTISTFRYKIDNSDKLFYEQRLFMIQSLNCGIDFLAISDKNDHKLVQKVVSNFHKTM